MSPWWLLSHLMWLPVINCVFRVGYRFGFDEQRKKLVQVLRDQREMPGIGKELERFAGILEKNGSCGE